jgi:hypothetical protein
MAHPTPDMRPRLNQTGGRLTHIYASVGEDPIGLLSIKIKRRGEAYELGRYARLHCGYL